MYLEILTLEFKLAPLSRDRICNSICTREELGFRWGVSMLNPMLIFNATKSDPLCQICGKTFSWFYWAGGSGLEVEAFLLQVATSRKLTDLLYLAASLCLLVCSSARLLVSLPSAASPRLPALVCQPSSASPRLPALVCQPSSASPRLSAFGCQPCLPVRSVTTPRPQGIFVTY
jgi:hypothetical protein